MADDLKPRTIIAMKGAPFTRKSTYATLIASTLNCPLFSVEEFLDILGPNDLQFAPLGDMDLVSSQPTKEMAMMIINQMTSSHLLNRVVDNIIIDSISSQSQLDSLTNLIAFCPKSRLIIVECKPNNLDSWKMFFEDHLKKAEDGVLPIMWYKAKSWEDVKEGIDNDDYDFWEYSLIVSKLVLDPLEDDLCINLSTLMSESDQPKYKPPPFMDALEYMMTRDDGPGVVPYHKWRQCPDPVKLMEALTGKDKCQRKGHCVTNYREELGDEETLICMACEEQVKGSAYTCNICNLGLHKECTESFDDTALTKPYPDVFRPEAPTYACTSCKKHDNGFSGEDCASCLFETNLKRRMMATVVHHGCDEHFLSLMLLAPDGEEDEERRCSACSYTVSCVFYACEICDKYYHINCLNEIPSTLKNDHLEKQDHSMRIDFSNRYEWYYDCEDCRYSANLEDFLDIFGPNNLQISPAKQ
ncbi:hypothetical protein V2J09_002800 [Rumex salicifolius]